MKQKNKGISQIFKIGLNMVVVGLVGKTISTSKLRELFIIIIAVGIVFTIISIINMVEIYLEEKRK